MTELEKKKTILDEPTLELLMRRLIWIGQVWLGQLYLLRVVAATNLQANLALLRDSHTEFNPHHLCLSMWSDVWCERDFSSGVVLQQGCLTVGLPAKSRPSRSSIQTPMSCVTIYTVSLHSPDENMSLLPSITQKSTPINNTRLLFHTANREAAVFPHVHPSLSD